MKILLRLLLCTATFGVSEIKPLRAEVLWGQAVNDVRLGLEIEERPFELGEKAPLSIKFTNSTAMPRFPAGPVHFGCPITVLNEQGQPVPRREDLRRETQAKAAGQPAPPAMRPPPMYGAAIKPGGTLGFAADLLRDFAIDQPGTYRVSAAGQVLSGLPYAPGSVPQPITSPTVVVQVVTNTSPRPVTTYSPTLAIKKPTSSPPQVAAPQAQVTAPPRRTPVEPPSVPVAAPAASPSRVSPALLGATLFGGLGLLVLYFMFRSGSR